MNSRRHFLSRLTRGMWLAGTPMYLAISRAIAETSQRRTPGIQSSTGEVIVDGATANPGQWPDRAGEIMVETRETEVTTILLGQDAFLVRSKSRVVIEQDDNFIIQGIRILSGKLLSVFGKRKEPLKATSTVATIGVRGTGLYVEAYPHLTYICTCYGTVALGSRANPEISETISTTHHESPRYVLDESRGGLIVPAPVFRHSDAELILLESLAGRPSPFPDDSPTSY